MTSDRGDDSPGAYPLIGGFVRVIIEQCAAGRIGTVQCFSGSSPGRFGYGFVDLSVIDGGKGSRLIDHLGNTVRKRRRFHTVQDYGTYCHLANVGFSPGFSRNDPGEKFKI